MVSGGLKETTLAEPSLRSPEEIIRHAVRGMMLRAAPADRFQEAKGIRRT